MKKILSLAVASTALMAAPAYAVDGAGDSDSQDFDITANVQQECSVEDPENVDFGTIAIDEAPGAGALLAISGRTTLRQNVWVSCNAM